ncbi:hypothetical protein BCR39DRAFT_485643 [Naematelia encephala]|uniref:Uncharacterized protein n=1 Tax=Naematelia encephala TaxID=71784 RepID=A0A1Y2ARS2_9TREE|nr:hypothetical protein BCR39DRAFT_485643 [Naematelia encephala]
MAEPPAKKFRYTSYNERINDISIDIGRSKGLSWEKEDYGEDDVEPTRTPFSDELARLTLLDLTAPFQELQRVLIPLTSSLAITLHNLPSITSTFVAFYDALKPGDEHLHSGLDSALQLHQALYETCLGETLPYLSRTVEAILRVGALSRLDPKLVERAYSTLSQILRISSAQLLKPDESAQQVLRETWTAVRPYLRPRQNKRYVRKCVADAWIGVIRKARGDGLGRLMNVLLEGEDDGEGMEAVWSHSFKGISGQLHSRALPIFEILLDRLKTSPSISQQTKTLQLVLVSLIHHCTSTTIVPIIQAVVSHVNPTGSEPSSSSKAMSLSTSVPFLKLLSTLLLTRKGKRFPEALLKPTMVTLGSLVKHFTKDTDEEWKHALIECFVGSLQAGKLAQWLSPGVLLIDALWARLSITDRFAFANMLVSLKWPGIEQFLLPHIAKSTLPSLSSHPLPTLTLLNNLAASGYLSGGLLNVQGGRWRQAFVSTLVERLQAYESIPEAIDDRRIFGQMLRLLPCLGTDAKEFAPHLASMITAILQRCSTMTRDALRSDFETETWNESHVLGELLRCADAMISNGDVEQAVKAVLLGRAAMADILTKWSWNREVLSTIAPFFDLWEADELVQSIDKATLLANLMSADSQLRQASLRILAAASPSASSSGTGERDIWSLCLQIESAEMTLRNVRDRTTLIARLGRLLGALSVEERASMSSTVRAALTYLVAQFKVNFRPLYAQSISTLASLAGQYGDDIWAIVWDQLEQTQAAQKPAMIDLHVQNPTWAERKAHRTITESNLADEDEAEFQCHNLEKAQNISRRAWRGTTDISELDEDDIERQISHDRLDVLNYEAQLLAALTASPLVAEKHTRLLVPTFFSIARHEELASLMQLSRKQLQQRTAYWLELFAHFVNPKAAYRTDELQALYLDILAKGDQKMQGLALKCLLTYKSPKLLPYEEQLKGLLDDAKFRDTLVHFQLGVDGDTIDPVHRDEVVPVAIRLLFGVVTSRRGRSSTAQGQGAKKQAVLTALSSVSSEELGTLVDLMLEQFPKDTGTVFAVAGRQQLGFLALLQDVLRYLAPQSVEHWPRLLPTTIRLVDNAQQRIAGESTVTIDAEEEEPVDDDEKEEDGVDKGTAPLRNIRTTGIKRLVQFLRSPTNFDFTPYLPDIFTKIISPRLGMLEIENTQAPSGTLDLIAALAASPETAHSLVQYDERTLPKTFACMTAVKVKPAVIGRVFDVIDSLLMDDSENGIEKSTTETVLLPHIRALLDNVIGLVRNLNQASNEDIMRRLLSILSRLSAVVTDGDQAQQLASLLGPMLRQSNRQISEKGKLNVLTTLQRLYTISPDCADPSTTFFEHNYDLISNLFQTMFFPSSRRALVAVLQTFSDSDARLAKSVHLVAEINAYGKRRMDEPDFDRRLAAFAEINDAVLDDLPTTVRQWMPLLRSALFFIQEPEELSIRSNSSALLQRFISIVGSASEGPLVDTLLNVILPGLRRALRSKIELVRNEVLQVVSHAVRTCINVPLFAELKPLLSDDDETNFFLNISHIQVHRRARALRRLRDLLSEITIRETTISTILIPIAEHIIAGSTDVTDHHLVNEAITTIGALAGKLKWSRYNALLMRYHRLGLVRNAQQKFYIRAVSAVIDNFAFDLTPATAAINGDKPLTEPVPAVADGEKPEVESLSIMNNGDKPQGDGEEEQVEDVEEDGEVPVPALEVQSGPSAERITEVILNRILPSLSKFVSKNDETENNIRIPLALGTVKIASVLPGDASDVEVLRVITIVSQILRSKDQDTRDIARDTICKIAVFLGPDWLVRVLKELRTALQRGPQKHVGAVVTHAILALATTEAADRFADLDDAVEDAVQVSAEVIWGQSGKDVASEGFKTKMREVRGATSRGFDTFQLVSKLVSPRKLGTVLAPLREIMHSSQSVKTMLHVDEALRRIAIGLNGNSKLAPEDILSLCYSLISGNSNYSRVKRKAPKASQAADAYRVQMKREEKVEVDFFALNAHKFVAFGLELFVTAFRRGKFDFANVDILARLGPLVGAIRETLVSSATTVQILGLKATAAIVRCPIPQVDEMLPVFITSIFKTLKQSGGTAESEVAQTALRTLAVVLRDCKSSQITDYQLKYLLELMGPDLEEPDRQSAIFAILRAVVGRQFVVPEIYDLMERVSSIMVTSQSTHVQELCRGVLMAFLLDYPQGKGRLKSQMTFLAQNLDYVFESGRVSVMELLSAIFTKFSDELVSEYADLFFVALVAVLANDDSEKCRTMAGALLGVLFTRMDDKQRKGIMEVMRSWVEARGTDPALAGAALSVYGLLADSQVEDGFIAVLVEVVEPVIAESAETLAEAESSDSAFISFELDHTLSHRALSALNKVIKSSPGISNTVQWSSVIPHLLFPHDWVRFAAARCLATLFAIDSNAFALLGDEALLDIARKSCLLFNGSKGADGESLIVDAKLADELVKLLWNISKYWATSETPGKVDNSEIEAEGEVEEENHDEVEEGKHDEGAERARPLAWIMSRMSFIARHLIVSRPSGHEIFRSGTSWAAPVTSVLRFFAGVFEALDVDQAKHFLPHILSPVYRILDEGGDLTSADSGAGVDELKQLALEVRDFVQTKVGATSFSTAWEALRRKVGEKREGRKAERTRLAVSDPKKWAGRKEKRGVMKKESKKRKVKSFSDKRNSGKAGQRRG